MDDIKKIAIERWLHKANNDLRTAETMLTADPPTTDTICFHAQQCVEKSLKAYLVYIDQHVERTHYLPRLVEVCAQRDAEFRGLMETARQLTDYAVTDRYPDNWREIPLSEATNAVEKATGIFQLVKKKLELTL